PPPCHLPALVHSCCLAPRIRHPFPPRRSSELAARPAALPVLDLETEPLSSREERYPLIEEAHRASSLGSGEEAAAWRARADAVSDRKSTRLNSSHGSISYAVFCSINKQREQLH